jgi:hypothetical protein
LAGAVLARLIQQVCHLRQVSGPGQMKAPQHTPVGLSPFQGAAWGLTRLTARLSRVIVPAPIPSREAAMRFSVVFLGAVLAGLSLTAQAADQSPARRGAYKLVTKDGVKLYCRTDTDTGSHLRQTTSCLTEKELTELNERTQMGLRDMTRNVPPRQGT